MFRLLNPDGNVLKQLLALQHIGFALRHLGKPKSLRHFLYIKTAKRRRLHKADAAVEEVAECRETIVSGPLRIKFALQGIPFPAN